jgi:hypothetical protein
MKLTKQFLPSLAAALCLFAGGELRADFLQTVTFKVTTFTQLIGVIDGSNTIIPSPWTQTHTTAEVLKTLASDANIGLGWPSNSFPSTAKLAVGTNGFVVIDGTNVLVDVSSIIRFQAGDHDIKSGKKNNPTGLAAPSAKDLQIARFTFDDSSFTNSVGSVTNGVGLTFYIQGIFSNITTDTAPKNGTYTETRTAKLINGAGEGHDSNGAPFMCTGTVTVTGKANLQLQ